MSKHFCTIFFFSFILGYIPGCFLVFWEKGKHQFPALTHQTLLLSNELKQNTVEKKMWDRTKFLFGFPLHLLRIGNLTEQDTHNILRSPNPKNSQKFSYKVNSRLTDRLLQSKKSKHKETGLEILESNKKKIPDKLFLALEDKDPYIKITTIHILKAKLHPLSNHHISRLLYDQNEFVRIETLRYLQELNKNITLLPIIYIHIQDSSPFVRYEIAKLLGIWKDRRNIFYLQKLFRDPERHVQEESLKSLKKYSK